MVYYPFILKIASGEAFTINSLFYDFMSAFSVPAFNKGLGKIA
jgi:hypothetical protein